MHVRKKTLKGRKLYYKFSFVNCKYFQDLPEPLCSTLGLSTSSCYQVSELTLMFHLGMNPTQELYMCCDSVTQRNVLCLLGWFTGMEPHCDDVETV